jgi:UTP:GlnB (protein PII) uridylyltransferase
MNHTTISQMQMLTRAVTQVACARHTAAALPHAALSISSKRRLARLAVAGSAAAPPSGRRAGLSIVAAVPSPAVGAKQEPQEIPTVLIDNMSDPLATIITVKFGDLLGELLDTTQALKNLGLDITRAELKAGENRNRFYVTDAKTSDKIVLSERLEIIRETIIQNMLQYHPEAASAGLAMHLTAKSVTETERPLGAKKPNSVPTRIGFRPSASGARSELSIETTDRPGLLVDIVRVLKDCSLNVVSAKIETAGETAIDTFFVTYKGKALEGPMVELVRNALTYYLNMAEIEANESY